MIQRLAELCGIDADEDIVSEVEKMTTREFMYAHKDRFDDGMACAIMEQKLGIPADSDSTKVQAEGSDPKQVPASVVEQIDAMWAERVTPVTGHANFAELAAELDK